MDDRGRREQNRFAWVQEHHNPTLMPMAGTELSFALLKLFEVLEAQSLPLGSQALDIGCGKGRDALELARRGLQVTAFDFVKEAVSTLRARARLAGLSINSSVGVMDCAWPYADATFDLIVDNTASMSIGYEAGIAVCRQETVRVLKAGGYLLLYTLAEDDPFLWAFPKGEEPSTRVTPDGKIERLFAAAELRKLYSRLHLIHQERRTKPASDTKAERRGHWMLFQKMSS
ncbi:hypothetical protein KSF_107890 [Reticulibacter mediterranei]|uniref:Methyltransferase domain-containing protein n=1 Tax=Reticulibacter mediterranei TaxID=2778369 RepID=A0A8J3J387_9CHLR|nr:class I SAM-dependent methyltransferase [Reticulibacter mediterranei]GHP00742.1 hypothetical protein KSF_107890 [Reticulibacter mediterranei]